MSWRRLLSPLTVSRALSLNAEIVLQPSDPLALSGQLLQSRIDPMESGVQPLLRTAQGPAHFKGNILGLLDFALEIFPPSFVQRLPGSRPSRGKSRDHPEAGTTCHAGPSLQERAPVERRVESLEAHDSDILTGNLAWLATFRHLPPNLSRGYTSMTLGIQHWGHPAREPD